MHENSEIFNFSVYSFKKEQEDSVTMKPNPVDIGEGTWNTCMFMERRWLSLHKII